MRMVKAAMMSLVVGCMTFAGCKCTDTTQAGPYGGTYYTKCEMGCLNGKTCGCSPGCPCHKKGCKGECSTCHP